MVKFEPEYNQEYFQGVWKSKRPKVIPYLLEFGEMKKTDDEFWSVRYLENLFYYRWGRHTVLASELDSSQFCKGLLSLIGRQISLPTQAKIITTIGEMKPPDNELFLEELNIFKKQYKWLRHIPIFYDFGHYADNLVLYLKKSKSITFHDSFRIARFYANYFYENNITNILKAKDVINRINKQGRPKKSVKELSDMLLGQGGTLHQNYDITIEELLKAFMLSYRKLQRLKAQSKKRENK